MDKVLVVGGGGMLGHQLFLCLEEDHNINVKATLHKGLSDPKYNGIFKFYNAFDNVDINDNKLEQIFKNFCPNVVVNCVGIIKQREEGSDPIINIKVNGLFPHQLSLLSQKYKFRLIHLSTDCVFSGKKGNYLESDISDAKDIYGKSKYIGEIGEPNLTIRTSIIGPELCRKKGLLEWFLSQQEKTVKGFKNAIFSGFTTYELSRIIKHIIQNEENLKGLIHISSKLISKYDLLSQIKEAMNLNIEIVPDQDFYCDRSLNCDLFKKQSNYNIPSWNEMISELANKLSN